MSGILAGLLVVLGMVIVAVYFDWRMYRRAWGRGGPPYFWPRRRRVGREG